MPPRQLDTRVAELRRQPGRTWGPPDALLAVLAVPATVAVLVVLVRLGASFPDAAASAVGTAAMCALAYLAGRRPARQSGGWQQALGLDLPEWRDTATVVGWTLLLLVAQVLAAAVLLVVPAVREAEPQGNTDLLLDQPTAALVVLALISVGVAPVVEELLFRGIVLRGLMLRWGFWPAALASTGCFALLHVQVLDAGALLVLVPIGTLGVGLCVLTRRTGRLGPAIGVHALYNAGVFLLTVATG